MLQIKTLLFCVIMSLSLVSSVYADGVIGLTNGFNILSTRVDVVNYGNSTSVSSTNVLPYAYSGVYAVKPSYLASEGFSSTQGKNNWYYQEWNGTSYVNLGWDVGNSRWVGSYPTTLIGSNWQHPDNYDSVRKWVAPQSGTISITGNVAKADAGGGDGVNVRVLKNTTSLWSTYIAYNDLTGFNVNLTVSVISGDAIYFIVNRNGSTPYDSTSWNPKISYQ